jgi:hypothetical protein
MKTIFKRKSYFKRNKKLLFLSLVGCFVISFSGLSADSFDSNMSNKTLELSGNLGWGCTYGTGLSGSLYLTKHFAVSAGAGLSLAGIKIGFGTKYIVRPNSRISPFIEASFAHVTGSSNTTINNEEYNATFEYDSAEILHLRTGLKLKTGSINLYGNIGYGILLNGGNSHYKSGNPNDIIIDLSQILEPGGVEVSVGASVMF